MAEPIDYRQALTDAVRLLDNARCDLGDPSLRLRWGRERKRLRELAERAERSEAADTPPDPTPIDEQCEHVWRIGAHEIGKHGYPFKQHQYCEVCDLSHCPN